MKVETVNPFSEKVLDSYEVQPISVIKDKVANLRRAQAGWKKRIDRRVESLKDVKTRMEKELPDLARLMSIEMGKPVAQSESELKKCISLIDYVTTNLDNFLSPEYIKTEARKAYVNFEPVGVVLLVMPWNFPAWQVLRAAIPAMAAGNAVILKHASIVSGTSLRLQEIIGLDVFNSVVTTGELALESLQFVDGLSFTGSTEVGSKLAERAGREIKKAVLELGGSDPFIVLEGTNLDEVVKSSAFARLQNNGQSCIASKRFLVHESIYDEFNRRFVEEFAKVRIGDPLDKSTFLGPMSSVGQKATVIRQIEQLRPQGEVIQPQERSDGNFVSPTIIKTEAVTNEEIFGPVAIVKPFRTSEEAVQLANETPFGLGASIWGDPEVAEKMAPQIEAGMVFINKIVASDPRLPFGGVKKSGIGRELSKHGLLEFTNMKTVWVS